SIKEALGYNRSDTDQDVYSDWKERTSRVCKPCWEIKYCPYGPLVEQSPILPSLRAPASEQIEYFKNCLATNMVGSVKPLSDERRSYYEKWVADDQILLRQAITEIRNQEELKRAEEEPTAEAQIDAWMGTGPLPSIEVYRTKFDIEDDEDL